MKSDPFLLQSIADVAGLFNVDTRQTRLKQLAHQKVHAYLQCLRSLEELGELAARHPDHANNARRDLGNPHAAQVAGGEEDLDGLWAMNHLMLLRPIQKSLKLHKAAR